MDSTDIDDQGVFNSDPDFIETANNYVRDKMGRLVKDRQEEIDTVIWTASNKVKEIRRNFDSNKKNIIFDYDAMGNQIAKHVYNNQTLMLEKSTYYILDAQGNQLSIYEHSVDSATNTAYYYLTDRNIYGSSRLGVTKDTINMFNPYTLQSYGVIGNRNYELTDHRGNVQTVINDIKYPLSSDNTTIDSYEVGINSVADYSPFGVQLDGRTIDNVFYYPENGNSPQTPADTVEIYNNDFDNPPATGSPYYSTEVTLDANLSNTKWTSSTGTFTNYNSSGAGSGKSIAISSASADTAYLTLSFDVENGYELDITSYSFAHRSSATGYNSYTLVVNGIEIGSGSIYVASSGSTLQSTGVVNANNTVSGVTGTVNVVLKLYGGTHGYSGTFRMDDFVLNGFVREENSGNSSSDYFVSRNYRNSFQGQEHHDEIRGKGNYINYKYRGHDPRVGRLDWLVDPLAPDYPWNSPYAFSENNVIHAVELEGLEKFEIFKSGEYLILNLIDVTSDLEIINRVDPNNITTHKNFVYRGFKEEVGEFSADKWTGDFTANNITYRNLNSRPGNPITPEYVVHITDATLLEKRPIAGKGLYTSGFRTVEEAFSTYEISEPLFNNQGDIIRDKIIPDNFDYVNIYIDESIYTKQEALEALGRRINITEKEVIFRDTPFNDNDEPDPTGESSITIGFGRYE